MTLRAAPALASLVAVLSLSGTARAFVSASVGGHVGEIDINSHVLLERGKVEPHEDRITFQQADIRIYNFGAGYTVGDLGFLQDFYVRLEGAYYHSPREFLRDTPVGPHEFYPADRGGWVMGTVATNFIHEPKYSFGIFLQGTVPISYDVEKFSNPHLHWFSPGTTVGIHLTDWLGFVNRIHFGSGIYEDDDVQENAFIALTGLFRLEHKWRWGGHSFKVGSYLGTYFEGDLNEHVDRRYNEVFQFPGDRHRAMRFATVVQPYVGTDNFAIEFGYVQKLFGYDPEATQFYTIGVRSSIPTL